VVEHDAPLAPLPDWLALLLGLADEMPGVP
jgi:hypothetical protein